MDKQFVVFAFLLFLSACVNASVSLSCCDDPPDIVKLLPPPPVPPGLDLTLSCDAFQAEWTTHVTGSLPSDDSFKQNGSTASASNILQTSATEVNSPQVDLVVSTVETEAKTAIFTDVTASRLENDSYGLVQPSDLVSSDGEADASLTQSLSFDHGGLTESVAKNAIKTSAVTTATIANVSDSNSDAMDGSYLIVRNVLVIIIVVLVFLIVVVVIIFWKKVYYRFSVSPCGLREGNMAPYDTSSVNSGHKPTVNVTLLQLDK